MSWQKKGLSWSWSYGCWIYDHLCNQCQSPLTLWVRIPLRRCVLDTTLCDQVCQWLTTDQWFSPGTLVSFTNKTDHHDITEILLKVALNTINQTKPSWLKISVVKTYIEVTPYVPHRFGIHYVTLLSILEIQSGHRHIFLVLWNESYHHIILLLFVGSIKSGKFSAQQKA